MLTWTRKRFARKDPTKDPAKDPKDPAVPSAGPTLTTFATNALHTESGNSSMSNETVETDFTIFYSKTEPSLALWPRSSRAALFMANHFMADNNGFYHFTDVSLAQLSAASDTNPVFSGRYMPIPQTTGHPQ